MESWIPTEDDGAVRATTFNQLQDIVDECVGLTNVHIGTDIEILRTIEVPRRCDLRLFPKPLELFENRDTQPYPVLSGMNYRYNYNNLESDEEDYIQDYVFFRSAAWNRTDATPPESSEDNNEQAETLARRDSHMGSDHSHNGVDPLGDDHQNMLRFSARGIVFANHDAERFDSSDSSLGYSNAGAVLRLDHSDVKLRDVVFTNITLGENAYVVNLARGHVELVDTDFDHISTYFGKSHIEPSFEVVTDRYVAFMNMYTFNYDCYGQTPKGVNLLDTDYGKLNLRQPCAYELGEEVSFEIGQGADGEGYYMDADVEGPLIRECRAAPSKCSFGSASAALVGSASSTTVAVSALFASAFAAVVSFM